MDLPANVKAALGADAGVGQAAQHGVAKRLARRLQGRFVEQPGLVVLGQDVHDETVEGEVFLVRLGGAFDGVEEVPAQLQRLDGRFLQQMPDPAHPFTEEPCLGFGLFVVFRGFRSPRGAAVRAGSRRVELVLKLHPHQVHHLRL